MEKEKLIQSFITSITESFISDYERIENSKNILNIYLVEIKLDYKYDYNTFCKEFLASVNNELNNMSIENIQNIDSISFTYTIINNMIKNKMNEIITNEKDKLTMMLLYDLKEHLSKNNF
jgi:hypothetical protein